MNYLDVWKKKMQNSGGTISNSIKESNDYSYNSEFTDDPSYREATTLDNRKRSGFLDIRLTNTNKSNVKKLYLRPNTKIDKGLYIKFDDKIFIAYDFEYNLQSPCILGYECNNSLNLKGWLEPIPCYCDNSSYGVKGVIDTEQLNLVDGKMLFYVQDNVITNKIKIDMRFILDNSEDQIYQVVSSETSVTGKGKIRRIVMNKVSYIEGKDDLINNIAYNPMLEETKPIEPIPSDIYILPSYGFELSRYVSSTYTVVNKDKTPSLDKWEITVNYNGISENHISIISTNDNSIRIKNNLGKHTNKIKITFKNGDEILESEVSLI